MVRCIVCKTGKLEQSGSHWYCDNCNFSQFFMTDDYLDIAKNLLAVLVSNTKFDDEEALGHVVVHNISNHMPMLDDWLVSISSGKPEVFESILGDIKQRAINLQIDQQVLNPEDAARQLVCQCGSSDAFQMVTVGKLLCRDCGAEYNYNETEGKYMPYFLCECGSASYEQIDASGLCACAGGCGKLYMHGADGVFRKLKL